MLVVPCPGSRPGHMSPTPLHSRISPGGGPSALDLQWAKTTPRRTDIPPHSAAMGEGRGDSPDNPPGPGTDLSAILQTISASQALVEGKIREVRMDMALIRQDLRNATARLTEAESRISNVEDELGQLKAQMSTLQSHTLELHRRVEDAENRARRNNLCIIGFPEGIEQGKTVSSNETWLKSWLPADALSTWFSIERAHRSLAPHGCLTPSHYHPPPELPR